MRLWTMSAMEAAVDRDMERRELVRGEWSTDDLPYCACLEEGERVGRFLILRDQDGCLHAVAAGAVSVLRETDDGTLLMMSGGRILSVPRAMRSVLEWLDGRG